VTLPNWAANRRIRVLVSRGYAATNDQSGDVMKKAGSSLTIKYGSHNPVRTTQVRIT